MTDDHTAGSRAIKWLREHGTAVVFVLSVLLAVGAIAISNEDKWWHYPEVALLGLTFVYLVVAICTHFRILNDVIPWRQNRAVILFLMTALTILDAMDCFGSKTQRGRDSASYGAYRPNARKRVLQLVGNEGAIPFLVEIPIGSVSSFMPLPCHSGSTTTAMLPEGGGVGDSQPPSEGEARCPGSPSPANGASAPSSASDPPCRCGRTESSSTPSNPLFESKPWARAATS